jgi:hypothetical protein
MLSSIRLQQQHIWYVLSTEDSNINTVWYALSTEDSNINTIL